MTSFIDMMADHDWSPDDITNRTENMIRAEFSLQDEMILNRERQALIDFPNLLPTDKKTEIEAKLERFKELSMEAMAENAYANADMAMLRQAFAVEAAQRRLSLPVFNPDTFMGDGEFSQNADPVLVDTLRNKDTAERSDAQQVLNTATADVMNLVQRRADYKNQLLNGTEPIQTE